MNNFLSVKGVGDGWLKVGDGLVVMGSFVVVFVVGDIMMDICMENVLLYGYW